MTLKLSFKGVYNQVELDFHIPPNTQVDQPDRSLSGSQPKEDSHPVQNTVKRCRTPISMM